MLRVGHQEFTSGSSLDGLCSHVKVDLSVLLGWMTIIQELLLEHTYRLSYERMGEKGYPVCESIRACLLWIFSD